MTPEFPDSGCPVVKPSHYTAAHLTLLREKLKIYSLITHTLSRPLIWNTLEIKPLLDERPKI